MFPIVRQLALTGFYFALAAANDDADDNSEKIPTFESLSWWPKYQADLAREREREGANVLLPPTGGPQASPVVPEPRKRLHGKPVISSGEMTPQQKVMSAITTEEVSDPPARAMMQKDMPPATAPILGGTSVAKVDAASFGEQEPPLDGRSDSDLQTQKTSADGKLIAHLAKPLEALEVKDDGSMEKATVVLLKPQKFTDSNEVSVLESEDGKENLQEEIQKLVEKSQRIAASEPTNVKEEELATENEKLREEIAKLKQKKQLATENEKLREEIAKLKQKTQGGRKMRREQRPTAVTPPPPSAEVIEEVTHQKRPLGVSLLKDEGKVIPATIRTHLRGDDVSQTASDADVAPAPDDAGNDDDDDDEGPSTSTSSTAWYGKIVLSEVSDKPTGF